MSEPITNRTKEDILKDIEEKLKEEKWTRAAIESYTVKNFIELDGVIRLAVTEGFKEDLKTLCKENLKHYSNSVVGLYIVGILSMEESAVDDTHLPQLIKLFLENKKFKIAEFLAEKILSFRENKFALKTLESVYENTGAQDELFNIKKRLVLIDNRDAGNAKYLGEYYEKTGDRDQSMFYYRLAIERYITIKNPKMIEDLWSRELKLYPEDPQLVITLCRKIREVLGDERVADMAHNDFVKPMMKSGKYREALTVLKVVIDFKQVDKGLRKAIEDCYRVLYANHSELEKYLKLSAIGQSWKPHREAIRVFEQHIAFDKGVYVSHKSWGIGTVQDIQNETVTVDFDGKQGHQMALEVALRALNVLDNDHIVIWKKFRAEELKKTARENPVQVLEIILRGNSADARGGMTTSEIKQTLVPDIFTEAEWNKWWNQAKRALEGHTGIVWNLSKKNVLELRESDLSLSDEIVSRFKKTTTFDNKIRLVVDFLAAGGDINLPAAAALQNYFTEIINASSEPSERKLASQIALKYAGSKAYDENAVEPVLLLEIKNPLEFYEWLDPELKKIYLTLLQKKLKDWDLKFADFIVNSTFTKLDRFMLNELQSQGKTDVINTVFATAMSSYQEKPELFLWASRLLLDEAEEAFRQIVGIKENEIVFRLLSLVDVLNSEIEQKTNVGRDKKIVGAITELLFRRKTLQSLIEKGDESTVKSVYTVLNSSATLEETRKEEALNWVLARFPDMQKASTAAAPKPALRHPFLVTKSSLETKRRELARIMTVDIPENSRSIGEAMEKGDLRENAEYKAALEKQDQLKAAASKLENEINQARAIDHALVSTDTIDVGTRVSLKDENGNREEYQILGQWDVNFEKRVISYHSPLGSALLEKRVGDVVPFDFNGERKTYTVVGIEIADFD